MKKQKRRKISKKIINAIHKDINDWLVEIQKRRSKGDKNENTK